MSEERAVINRIWSRVLLEELSRLGVENVCVAPGSRSTPLIVEANNNSKLTLHTHFDERGLGFLALGMAKASQKPVAVVVTSGTAVANLLPAITEAKLTGEKLVVLTADRPVELIGCGANQAIEQSGIFSHHVTEAINLPSPTTDIPLSWLLTTIDDVMFKQSQLGGAIHINCPYPEPLYTDKSSWNDSNYCQQVNLWMCSEKSYSTKWRSDSVSCYDLAEFIDKKGIILIGSLPLSQANQAKSLAEKLGWPVLCDPQSGVSSHWSHYDLWLQNPKLKQVLSQCEIIVQLGERLVSKRLTSWIAEHVQATSCPYLFISPSWSRSNQSHQSQSHIVADITHWLVKQLNELSISNRAHASAGWADNLCDEITLISGLVSNLLKEQHSLSELAIASTVKQIANSCDLFVGNSLIVRLFDMFAELDSRNVYSNRGASGIDGLVATASGVQAVTGKPLVMFVGDSSLLYDLNSLALLRKITQPFVVIVTNNDGGAIFDLLPVAKEQKQALYQMPHGFDFEHAANMFKLKYECPVSLEQYQKIVNNHITNGIGGLIVEVKVPNEQAATHIKAIVRQVNAI